jgi:two-component system, NtrC family, sensor kinase
MDPAKLFSRYQELQRYVGWTESDTARMRDLKPLVAASFPGLVEDFYEEIERHPDALKVITGGSAQIERLKGTLVNWLDQLFSGCYDADYVYKRWKIGYRHVEIGLDQVFTNMALSRLRKGILRALDGVWTGSIEELLKSQASLNTLIDLDLALIEDAYQTEHLIRRQAAERLVLIGQVAGGIAHELRNPLNVIKTSVFYLLNAKAPSPEKTATHMERIERQVGQAENVIASLVRFAKMPVPELKPIDIPPLLRGVLAGMEWSAAVEVVEDYPPDLTPAVMDEGQIRIVLENLIRNACEAMPEGGRLTISAAVHHPYVDIHVKDSGHGIEREKLQRVMEPFYSTKSRGVGLGLAMAKALVEKNKGQLRVESEPGKGSTFTVRLTAASPSGVIADGRAR